jgi:hypothetical protein
VALEDNLQGLHARVQLGAYRAKPTRGAFIPKADGRLRPLGVAALEDKIVQRALVEMLNAIYEQDFLGFFVLVRLLVVRGGKVSGIRWRARSALEAGVTMR